MKRKVFGFTLIELIVVVIVIGILATMAIPQYLKATERALSAKAKNNLGLIAQAEKLYRAENDTYVAAGTAGELTTNGLQNYVELNDISGDTKWTYAVTGDASTFTATATRVAPTSDAGTIILNQSGTWTGTRTIK
ncbi:MAG: prepilin-type N-terminal cleavage/methylation domain-containing protein [Candidatus Omnitrophica bacterium]|nr:prepilin-type N-terminal cleavage/methylation domain-containing protein [Candidatus Omnitrophota bacterium]